MESLSLFIFFAWPILLPSIVVVIALIIWWLLARSKTQQAGQKDYSLLFIALAILLIALLGTYIYFTNKI